MFTCKTVAAASLAAGLLLAVAASAQDAGRYGFGHSPSAEEIKGWDIDVRPDGAGLPPGEGTAREGHAVFNQRCATCHGEDLQMQLGGALVGGIGSLDTEKPLRTVGSYWPYATTLFDYIRRAMPFDAPQTLSADEVYSTAAYILFRNDIIGESDMMNAETLARVRMPNRDGFVPDPRPDVFNTPCRTDCKKGAPGSQPAGSAGGTPPGDTGVGGGSSPQ